MNLTGGKTNYYLVQVDHPQREEQSPYQAECEDIIEALELTFDEANIFKEIWRGANARKSNGKPGHTAQYGAEKILHYATRNHRRVTRKPAVAGLTSMSTDNWTEHDGSIPSWVGTAPSVEVRFRNGGIEQGLAAHYNWKHTQHSSDIVAYRFRQPSSVV